MRHAHSTALSNARFCSFFTGAQAGVYAAVLARLVQRIAEDREKQRSKFGRVKPLWAIESKEDTSAATMAELDSFDKQDIRGA